MLSPETIQLMVQTYEEWMRDSSVVSRPLETMRWAYEQICAEEDPWTGLGSFSHTRHGYTQDKRAALVSEPLTHPEQETTIRADGRLSVLPPLSFYASAMTFRARRGSMSHDIPCQSRGLEVTASQISPHTTSKPLRSRLPGATFSVGVASSKINMNSLSGCWRPGAKVSPIRRKYAGIHAKEKNNFSELLFFEEVAED